MLDTASYIIQSDSSSVVEPSWCSLIAAAMICTDTTF